MAENRDDFLSRWSRRKAAARDGNPEAEATETAAVDPARIPESPKPPEGAEPPAAEGGGAADFADVDFGALDYGSDYTRFMKPGVPADIRRRALRALWRSNPVLANQDGLDDYIDDYTDKAVVPPVLKTAYRIGRGFLSEADERPAAPATSGGADAAADTQGSDAGAEVPGDDQPDAPDDGPQRV